VDAVEEAVQEYNMHRLLRSVCIFWRSCTTRISRGSARAVTGSWQHRHASLHSHAALCTSTVTLTPRSRRPSSNKRPIPPWSILRRNVSLARCPGRLLMSPSGIQQPSRPSHHTTQSHKPPVLTAVYIYSRRASSSVIRTETRLCKRASYDMHLLPAPQGTHAAAPAGEYVPAQHRHGSVDTHEPLRLTLLHQLPSAARSHAPMLHVPHVLRNTERGEVGLETGVPLASRRHPTRSLARGMHTRAASHDTHTHIRVPHSRPAISDSPAGHVVHAEPVLEIRIR
jgi:hypothetical protein